jgi:sugar-specific transcriptional regulator TrmB
VNELSYEDLLRLKQTLIPLGLTQYEAATLGYLALFGETKATKIAKTTKIPTARIYETLDALTKLGLVRIKPGRPTLYHAVPPPQAIDILVSIKRQELEAMKKHAKEFVRAIHVLDKEREMVSTHTPLLRIVGLGEVSETETRRLYGKSRKQILVLTRAGDYLTSLLDALHRAAERGINVKVILAAPQILSFEEKRIQQGVISRLKKALGRSILLRFSPDVPLRGTIVDPNSPNAEALFFAQEADVAPIFREAAISSNRGLVTALALFFRLIWKDAMPG